MNYQTKLYYCEYIRQDLEKIINTDNIRVDVHPDRNETLCVTLIDKCSYDMIAINLDMPLVTNYSLKTGSYPFIHKLIGELVTRRYYKQERK